MAAVGMAVAVVNTALSTRSDNTGHFTLANVPAGDVQLRVSGSGADAIVAVGTLQPSQTMEIVVTVSGSAAKVDPPGRTEAETEVEGAIEAVPPATAASTFRVSGRTVHTDSSTEIRDGSQTTSFSALKVGTRVEVHGVLSGDTLNATIVELLRDNQGPGKPEAETGETELKGVVSGLAGTASSFTFMIGSTTVNGDSSTAFDSSHASGSGGSIFGSLKSGLTVEVKGEATGTTVRASRIQIEDDNDAADDNDDKNNDDNDDNEDNNEVELKGTLGAITSTCPAISSTVGATKFSTSSSTRFDVSCSSLKSGDKVEVKGTRLANGTVAASRVKKD